jgi:hypothetical protein
MSQNIRKKAMTYMECFEQLGRKKMIYKVKMVLGRMRIYYTVCFTNGSQPQLDPQSGSCSINSQKCVEQSRSESISRFYK